MNDRPTKTEEEEEEELLALLGGRDEASEELDLVEEIHAQVEREDKKKRRLFRYGPMLAAAAAFVVFIVSQRPSPGPSDELRPKSASAQKTAWVGIQAYVHQEQRAPTRLKTRMYPSDPLRFSYTNLMQNDAPTHLMIFAVDADQKVRWYHPAYLNPAQDPRSLPIQQNVAEQHLNGAVLHSLPTGPLMLFGLFSKTPLQVSKVETLVAEQLKADRLGERLPIEGLIEQHVEKTEVQK